MAKNKVTKDYAKYQREPNGSEQCSKCTMYTPPGVCDAVKGTVSYRGWCRFFERE